MLPAPPPGRGGNGGGGGTEALAGSGGAGSIGGAAQEGAATPRSDGDTPTLMNADWNWDVDTLDEQLFSFLLDTPPNS